MTNIKSIKPVEAGQTYDLEIDHPDHQFYLSNGILTSNSHSILYSFISYHTAYLKANYRLPFLCATLIAESSSNAKKAAREILKLKEEIRKSNVNIIPPSINKSLTTYKVLDEHTLLSGINAIKFTGKDCGPEILAKRPFVDLQDMLTKIDTRKVRANAIQALAAAGALDEFGKSRKQIFLYAADFKKKFALWSKKNDSKDSVFEYPWPEVGEWTPPQKAAMEIYYLGESLNSNVREIYPDFFPNSVVNFKNLYETYKDSTDKRIEHKSNMGEICGVITDFYEFRVKKEKSKIFGKKMARITLQDLTGNSVNVTVFPDQLTQLYSRARALGGRSLTLGVGCAMIIAGQLEVVEDNIAVIFSDLKKIAPPPAKPSKKELEPQSVKMKISSPRKTRIKKIDNIQLFMNEVEEELVEEGEAELEHQIIEEENSFEPEEKYKKVIEDEDYKDPFGEL